MPERNQLRLILELNQMDECVGSLKRVTQSLENIQIDLSNILSLDDQTSWSGEAQKAYMLSIGDSIMLLHKTRLAFSKEHQNLKTAIAVYRQKEGLVQADLEKLSTTNLFE